MKVKELIDKLKKMDEQADVCLYALCVPYNGVVDVDDVTEENGVVYIESK